MHGIGGLKTVIKIFLNRLVCLFLGHDSNESVCRTFMFDDLEYTFIQIRCSRCKISHPVIISTSIRPLKVKDNA